MPLKDDKTAGVNKEHGRSWINVENNGDQLGRA